MILLKDNSDSTSACDLYLQQCFTAIHNYLKLTIIVLLNNSIANLHCVNLCFYDFKGCLQQKNDTQCCSDLNPVKTTAWHAVSFGKHNQHILFYHYHL